MLTRAQMPEPLTWSYYLKLELPFSQDSLGVGIGFVIQEVEGIAGYLLGKFRFLESWCFLRAVEKIYNET